MKIIELYENRELSEDFDGMVELIRADCKPFLEQANGVMLYRGMHKTSTYLKMTVRSDRKPKNTSAAEHAVIDDWFNEKFGFRARSAAVFGSGEFADARLYGKVFAIFPIGRFEFVWSPIVSDLFVDIADSTGDDSKDSIINFLEQAEYTDKNLSRGILSNNEVMIHCGTYYAVRLSRPEESEPWLTAIYEG